MSFVETQHRQFDWLAEAAFAWLKPVSTASAGPSANNWMSVFIARKSNWFIVTLDQEPRERKLGKKLLVVVLGREGSDWIVEALLLLLLLFVVNWLSEGTGGRVGIGAN